MPKYREKPTTLMGWFLLLLFISGVTWLIWSAPIILLIVPVLIYTEYVNGKESKKHYELLINGRENDSICTFTRYFEYREIDTWVIRAVYEQLQNYMAPIRKGFPIHPTDDVFTDLRIDDEDFELDLIEEIAERTGRSLEGSESNEYYGKSDTVENLVYFFNNQPKVNET